MWGSQAKVQLPTAGIHSKPTTRSPLNIVKDRDKVSASLVSWMASLTGTAFSILFCVVLAGLLNKSLFKLRFARTLLFW